jgi:hypothetical protein
LKPVGFDAGRPQEFCEACSRERIRARKRAWNERRKSNINADRAFAVLVRVTEHFSDEEGGRALVAASQTHRADTGSR